MSRLNGLAPHLHFGARVTTFQDDLSHEIRQSTPSLGFLLGLKCQLHDFCRFALTGFELPLCHGILRRLAQHRVPPQRACRLDGAVRTHHCLYLDCPMKVQFLRKIGIRRRNPRRHLPFRAAGAGAILRSCDARAAQNQANAYACKSSKHHLPFPGYGYPLRLLVITSSDKGTEGIVPK